MLQVLIGFGDIAKNQTSNVSVKGIKKKHKQENKRKRKLLTTAMRKIKVKDQDRQEGVNS